MSLTDFLSNIFGDAFAHLDLPHELGVVRMSDRPDLCQFQCNGALAAAKQHKQNPRDVAAKIIAHVQDNHDIFETLDMAGPGFVNITLTPSFLSGYLSDTIAPEYKAKNETIVLDYGGPNVAKPMHVGHLRSSIIGDSLRRMYTFAGYNTIGDVHLGDWGLPMGQVISALEIAHPDWPYFDDGYNGDYPTESPVTIKDLETIYPQASGACKEDKTRLEQARKATLELQQGRKGYRALWRHFVDISIASMKENFDALNVHFDLWEGESDVHDDIAPLVETLKSKNIAQESDGALIIPVAQNDDKKDMPPLILYKSDGAVMYSTTDLATIDVRIKKYAPKKIIYIVDQRQSLHFQQLFRAADKAMLIADKESLIFAGFGTMNGTDGKPFKTRAGGVMKLNDLIALATEKAENRLDEANLASDIDTDERADIAHKVAIAALKFADLQNNRVSDYVFDIDRMTAFEGKTGPYLLYQCVRIRSLLNKAGYEPNDDAFVLQEPDTTLALAILQFRDKFDMALSQNAPHILCDYTYQLAQAFSTFYGACHIASETDDALKNSRLRLCHTVLHHLELCLSLLGIDTPERM